MSRRDDIECLGYVILYLMNPPYNLIPWATKEDANEVLKLKQQFLGLFENKANQQVASNQDSNS